MIDLFPPSWVMLLIVQVTGLWLTGFSKDNPVDLFDLGKRLLFLCYL